MNLLIDDTLKTLWDLVYEGELTVNEAVKMWCEETENTYTFAIKFGVYNYFNSAYSFVHGE